MPLFDHHVHTALHSPDSVLDPGALIDRARSIGLDGVVVTEHDVQWLPEELAEWSKDLHGLILLSGVEVSAREGHFLVYGLPDLSDIAPGIALTELLRIVRRRDAAIVAAHPFRWDQDFESIVREHGPAFDALELVSSNITPETREKTEGILAKHQDIMGATGSSDAHDVATIGCYHTSFDDVIRDINDFVRALHSRRFRPAHRSDAVLASGPVHSRTS